MIPVLPAGLVPGQPSEPQRDPLLTLLLIAAIGLGAYSVFRKPEAPAPNPTVIQPVVPQVIPVPPPSPCGPNRCPYRATPFVVACPYCSRRLTAIPPSEMGSAVGVGQVIK